MINERKYQGLYYKRNGAGLRRLLFSYLLLEIFLCFYTKTYAHIQNDCDEVLFSLSVEYLGKTEMPTLVCGDNIYISINSLFDFLEIRYFPSKDFSQLEGYFVNKSNNFIIDQTQGIITYKKIKFPVKAKDFLISNKNLFIRLHYLEKIFGLNVQSRFYDLSLSLESDLELPAVIAARREEIRNNINRFKQEIKSDKIIPRQKSFIDLGNINYRIQTSQRNGDNNYNIFSLGAGGIVAFGEFLASVNYNSALPLSNKHVFYRWRHVNNNNKVIRQVKLGRITTPSIASIFNPMTGVELTNAPTYNRKSFGTYKLSDFTEPGWVVELYINNILADYAKADSAGFYSFDVPMVYGSTEIIIKTYGPWGEEKVIKRRFKTPETFLPKNELEYAITAAKVGDSIHSDFAQLRVNYGLSSAITIGGGFEYLSSNDQAAVPYLNSYFRLGSNMHFYSEYSYGLGFKSSFRYTSNSRLNINIDYTKYRKDQNIVKYSYDEKRELKLSYPFSNNIFRGTTSFNFRQQISGKSKFSNIELIFSGSIGGIDTNINTRAFLTGHNDLLILSDLSFYLKPFEKLTIVPQVVFEYGSNRITSLRTEIRADIFHNGYLNVSYDQNLKFDQKYIQIGFRYDLPFANLGLSANYFDKKFGFTQSLSGGITKYPERGVRFTQNTVLNQSGVVFKGFLDINYNNKKDPLEPEVPGLSIKLIEGGGIKETMSDGGVLYTGLRPYSKHYFRIKVNKFESISWRIHNKTIEIELNPNQSRVVFIPIEVVGEVGGFVYLNKIEDGNEAGGIELSIYNENNQLIKQIRSESDGYFSYLGLKNGNYTIEIGSNGETDPTYKLKAPIHFSIQNESEGALIDNLEIVLK